MTRREEWNALTGAPCTAFRGLPGRKNARFDACIADCSVEWDMVFVLSVVRRGSDKLERFGKGESMVRPEKDLGTGESWNLCQVSEEYFGIGCRGTFPPNSPDYSAKIVECFQEAAKERRNREKTEVSNVRVNSIN